MTFDAFNAFCGALPATSYVMQWGGSHVWKVGGKVFAIGGSAGDAPAYSFKVGAVSFEILREQPGLRPAPYLASRGLTWIQAYDDGCAGLPDDALKDYLRQSHALIAGKLSKRKRLELGLSA